MDTTEDDLDTHMCLSCETTIIGLDNYIRHKKLECIHRKCSKKPEASASHHSTPMTVDVQEVGHLQPPSHMSPSTSGIVNPNIVLGSNNDEVDKFHDFISSLALQSRSNQPDKSVEKRPNDLDLMDLGNDRLPIPNLLTLNLGFSSDSDPDLSEYLKDSDDDYYPPENHTGGKWKSPESTGGKWKPTESTGGKWKTMEAHTGGKGKLGTRPPRGFTGGKWKPGMGPRPIGGKRARHISGDDAEDEDDDDEDTEEEDDAGPNDKESGYGGKVRRTGGKVFKHSEIEEESGPNDKESSTGGKVRRTGGKVFKYSEVEDEAGPDNKESSTGGKVRRTGGKVFKHQEVTEVKEEAGPTDKDSGTRGKVRQTVGKVFEHPEVTEVEEKAGLIDKDSGSGGKVRRTGGKVFKHLEVMEVEDQAGTDDKGSSTGGEVGRTGGKVFKHLLKDTNTDIKDIGVVEKDSTILGDDSQVPNQVDENLETEVGAADEDGTTSPKPDEVVQDVLPNEQEKDEEESLREEPDSEDEKGLYCPICKDKYYSNQYSFARHLLTQYHHNRAVGHPEAVKLFEKYHLLILRLSPFQCGSCKFYCNTNDDLKVHLKTSSHILSIADNLGPQLCTLCQFMTDCNDDMVDHVGSVGHVDQVNKLTRKRPCVIRENRKKVDCKECGHSVHSVTDLKKHILAKHRPNQKKYVNRTCPHCDKKFSSRISLGIHMRRRHTKEKPYTCDPCQKSYADKYTLELHMHSKAHTATLARLSGVGVTGGPALQRKKPNGKNPSTYYCDFCYFKTLNYKSLRPHFVKEHPNEAKTCKCCAVTMYRAVDFKHHMESKQHRSLSKVLEEDGDKIYRCPICQRVFEQEKSYLFHVMSQKCDRTAKTAGVEIRKKYKDFIANLPKIRSKKSVGCPECGKNISRASILQHLKIHVNVVKECTICSKTYTSLTTLQRHISTTHAGLQPFVCEECGKVFVKASSYHQHVAIIHRNAPKNFVCEICQHAFALKWQLTHHSKIHGQKHLRCTYEGCSLLFRSRSDMVIHLRTHTNERPFLCDQCGYRAKSQNQLTRHRRTHTGERNFSCEYCPYKALNSTHLRRHMRVHIGSKPYQCPYCSYACNTHENIRKHIMKTKKHAGLKVYVCKFCQFSTDNSKPFRDHLLSSHGEVIKDKLDIVSVYSGLYQRDDDPRFPLEGEQVLPIKERKKATTTQTPKKKRADKTMNTASASKARASTSVEISSGVVQEIDVQEGLVMGSPLDLSNTVKEKMLTHLVRQRKQPNMSELKEDINTDMTCGKYVYTPILWPTAVAEPVALTRPTQSLLTSASKNLQTPTKLKNVNNDSSKPEINKTILSPYVSEPNVFEPLLGNLVVALPEVSSTVASTYQGSGPLRALLDNDAILELPGVCASGSCPPQPSKDTLWSTSAPTQPSATGACSSLTLPLYSLKGDTNINPSPSDLADPSKMHLVSLHQLAVYPKNVIKSFIETVRNASTPSPKTPADVELAESKDLSHSLSLVEKARTPKSLVPVHQLINIADDFLFVLLEIAKGASFCNAAESAANNEGDVLVQNVHLSPVSSYDSGIQLLPLACISQSVPMCKMEGISSIAGSHHLVASTSHKADLIMDSSHKGDLIMGNKHTMQTTTAADIMLEMAEVVLSSCDDAKPDQNDHEMRQYAGQSYAIEDLEPSESIAIQLLSQLAQGGINTIIAPPITPSPVGKP